MQARVALHRGDVPAARRQLARSARQRPLLTYSYPHFAVQVRLELIRVHLALADPAGLDPSQAAGWAASMDRSIRQLSKFVRQMKEAAR